MFLLVYGQPTACSEEEKENGDEKQHKQPQVLDQT
jgi:hypothetical protein